MLVLAWCRLMHCGGCPSAACCSWACGPVRSRMASSQSDSYAPSCCAVLHRMPLCTTVNANAAAPSLRCPVLQVLVSLLLSGHFPKNAHCPISPLPCPHLSLTLPPSLHYPCPISLLPCPPCPPGASQPDDAGQPAGPCLCTHLQLLRPLNHHPLQVRCAAHNPLLWAVRLSSVCALVWWRCCLPFAHRPAAQPPTTCGGEAATRLRPVSCQSSCVPRLGGGFSLLTATPVSVLATRPHSKVLSMYRGDDGLWRLAFRVANLRQHQASCLQLGPVGSCQAQCSVSDCCARPACHAR